MGEQRWIRVQKRNGPWVTCNPQLIERVDGSALIFGSGRMATMHTSEELEAVIGEALGNEKPKRGRPLGSKTAKPAVATEGGDNGQCAKPD